MARVDRRRGHRSPRTPTATSTSTRLEAELGAVRRPPAEDRLVLRRLQRHRHRHRHPRASPTLLHRHGALSFWDFAAAAPYVEIEMYGAMRARTRRPTRTRCSCPRTSSSAARARRACWSCGGSCCATGCPTCPAAAPSPTSTRPSTTTSTDPAHREEGGTPAIVESIRAGLVFQLKQAVGRRRDPRARGALPAPRRRGLAGTSRTIEILGNLDAERLSIVSFVVRPRRRPLPAPQLRRRAAQRPVRHPVPRRLLVRRARTGTGCSASTWTGRTSSSGRSSRGCEGIKPGWVRVNFNYFISEAVFDYVVDAVHLVARRRLAAAAATTASTRPPGCGGTIGGPVEPPLRLSQCRTTRDGRCATRATTTRPGVGAGRLPRRGASGSSPTPTDRAGRAGVRAPSCPRTSSSCAGSSCRGVCAAFSATGAVPPEAERFAIPNPDGFRACREYPRDNARTASPRRSTMPRFRRSDQHLRRRRPGGGLPPSPAAPRRLRRAPSTGPICRPSSRPARSRWSTAATRENSATPI